MTDGADDYLTGLGMRPNSLFGVGGSSSVLMSQSQQQQGFGLGIGSGSSVSSYRQAAFIRPKRERAQVVPVHPVTTTSTTGSGGGGGGGWGSGSGSGSGRKPRRGRRDGNDSSSDDSAVELNDIFDNFFNSNDVVGYGDGVNDDDSVEDYHVLASKFDFKDSDSD
jgi:hypothetical protein